MTETLFLETDRYGEQLKEQGKRRLDVSGVLRILGVSRSGYLAWKKRFPSRQETRKKSIKEKILSIYDESHQNYGAPKIAGCCAGRAKRLQIKPLEITCGKWGSKRNISSIIQTLL